MSLFPGAHYGGAGWLGRWRQGLGGGFDLGLDAMGVQHGDQGAIDLKIAGRYQLSSHVRLEVGVGAHGYPGDVFGTGSTAPPADLVVISAVGASGRIDGSSRFAGELGVGPAFVQGYSGVGVVFHFGAGVVFDIGGKWHLFLFSCIHCRPDV
jgi:hypothetical protein